MTALGQDTLVICDTVSLPEGDIVYFSLAKAAANPDPSHHRPGVMADVASSPDTFDRNVEIEYERNSERYAFLKWGVRVATGLVRLEVVKGKAILFRVNGDGFDADFCSRTEYTDRDFRPIGRLSFA